MKALSVSELNIQIKSVLEHTFVDILLQGEVSSIKIHSSGHIYLSLKDEYASVRAVMFKGNARQLKVLPEVGESVLVSGSIGVFSPKGEYQIICKNITIAGLGELSVAFEKLKKNLEAKGYFELSHKKPITRFPKRMALIASATSAAKEDMLKIAKKRWELVEITLFDTLMQGENALDSIVYNLKRADSGFGSTKEYDVIVIARGGGSIEDMWVFNEEPLADCIFNAKTPIVSAIGHEIDVFISDFVADLRSPTPSAAMEMLLPDKNEYLRHIDEMITQNKINFKRVLSHKNEQLTQIKTYFNLYQFQQQFAHKDEQITTLTQLLQSRFVVILREYVALIEHLTLGLNNAYKAQIDSAQTHLNTLTQRMETYSIKRVQSQALVQILKYNRPCRLGDIALEEEFIIEDSTTSIKAKRIE